MNLRAFGVTLKKILSSVVLQKHVIRLKYLHNCHRTLALGGHSESNSLLRPTFLHRHMMLDDPLVTNIFTTCRTMAKKAIVKENKGKGKPRMLLKDEEMMEVIRIDVMRTQMQQVVDRLKDTFVQQLSVRSSSGSIENLRVLLEGEEHPLHEIAKIHKKNRNLIVVNMADFPEGLKPTLQAISNSQMNLNPQQDGTMIYVPLPKVTREHREALAKSAKMHLNKAKDELRDIQNKFQKDAKNKTDSFSEDLIFTIHSQIKEIADQYTAEAEVILKIKEKELLTEL